MGCKRPVSAHHPDRAPSPCVPPRWELRGVPIEELGESWALEGQGKVTRKPFLVQRAVA